MTIEAEIIRALRESRSALDAVMAEVTSAKVENAERLAKIAVLEAEVAALEDRAVDAVDPAIVQPVIEDLARIVAECAAFVPGQRSGASRLVRFARFSQDAVGPGEGPRRRSSASSWA